MTSNNLMRTRRTSNRLAERNKTIQNLNQLKKILGKKVITKKIIEQKLQKRKKVLKEREIDTINDFRYLKDGSIQYKVYYIDGIYEWQNENLMNGHSKVKDFQEKVKNKIGFLIPEQKFDSLPSTRSTRLAKSRARFHLKNVFEEEIGDEDMDIENLNYSDDDDDDDHTKSSSKRKRSGGSKTSNDKRSRKSGKKVQQEQQRKQRQLQRQSIILEDDDDTLLDDPTNCCVQCSTKAYRQAIHSHPNNTADLENIINNKSIASWKDENVYINTDNALKLALLKGNIQQAVLLDNDNQSAHATVPYQFKSYSNGSTGSNIKGHSFRNAMRKVNESRGNRQGNSAFYREPIYDPMNLEYEKQRNAKFTEMTVLSCLPHTNLTCLPNVIENLYLTKCNNFAGADLVYFAVASGNNILASKLMEEYKQMQWYNHLHMNTLKFINGEELESYRKNQILKQGKESKRLTPLSCAAINPSASYLKELYQQLEDLERSSMDELGRTIAHFAAASSTAACLEFLIEEKYSWLDSADKFKITPLIQAARYGRDANIKPLLSHLSENKLPSTAHADHTLLRSKSRPLHFAAAYGHTSTCQALIECGATIDIHDSIDKFTPLMLAAHRGYLETVQCLVENGANPEAIDKYGRTPLHLACIQGHYDIVKYLLTIGVDADFPDTSSNYPIHYAAAFGWLSIVKLLVDLGQVDLSAFNVWRSTPLSIALVKGHFSIVSFILSNDKQKINVNFKDANEMTMLHHCISNPISTISESEKNLKYLKLLLEKGADPNALTKDGINALHMLINVCKYDYSSLIKTKSVIKDYQIKATELLYQYEVDINVKDSNGLTPFSTMMELNYHHMVEWFIQHGITYWNDATKYKYNFFHYCFRAATMIDKLVVYTDDTNKEIMKIMENDFHKVWEAVESHLPALEDMDKLTLHEPNTHNLPPVIYGITNAAKNQIDNKEKKHDEFKHLFALFENLKKHFNLDLKNTLKGSGILHKVVPYRNVIMFKYLLENVYDPNETITKDSTTQILLGSILNQGVNPVYREPVYHKFTPNFVYDFLKAILPDWIKYGGDLRAKTDQNMTSIMYAVHYNHNQILGLLLDSTLGLYWRYKNTHLSSENDIINVVTDSKSTALSIAIFKALNVYINTREYTSIGYILDAGGDINFKYTEKGSTIFMKVLQSEDTKLVNLIFEKSRHPIDHTIINTDGTSALSIASASKSHANFTAYFEQFLKDCSSDTIAKLINTKQNSRRTCLQRAIESKNIEVVDKLLSHGADPNLTGSGNEYPLFTALRTTSMNVVIEKLLIAGANPNIHKETNGDTPLHIAIANGNIDAVKLLLKYNVDVNAVNHKLRTPMHIAISVSISKMTRSFSVERLLLKTGLIDINAMDILGRTPLHLAFIPNDSIPMTHIATAGKERFKIYKEQKEKKEQQSDKMDVDKTEDENDEEDDSDITFATFGLEYRSWLLETYNTKKTDENNKIKQSDEKEEETKENGSEVEMDVSFSDEEMKLFKAYEVYGDCWEETKCPPKQLDPIDMVNFLSVVNGIQYDIRDVFGRSPIHYAAILGAFTCTTFFLNKHIDINTLDGDNNTPFHLALIYNRSDYAVMLCNCGATLDELTNLYGKKYSVFTFCLANSYMNLVYLILGKGTNVLDGIQLALEKGDYYLAHILLESANHQSLHSKTSNNQNLWHIISNHHSLNNDTWEEYLIHFIEKLTEINLEITLDDNWRSPVHYAAEKDQFNILKHLLTLPNCPLNTFDKLDHSELWCAFSSKKIKNIELLLDNGASIDKAIKLEKKPSLLSMAINMCIGDVSIIKLLLSKGCSVDQDSMYNRPSPLMLAVAASKSSIVQLLIDHGADVNQICKYSSDSELAIHPLIAASIHSPESLKILINSGADVNTPGPSEDLLDFNKNILINKGTSFFLHNLYKKDENIIQLLQDKKINLNLPYKDTDKTIFTHIIFDYCNIYNRDEFWIKAMNIIFENYEKEEYSVNIIDKETGRRPLEIAIRKSITDIHLIRCLLKFGADPNLLSCDINAEPSDENYNEPLNAIFHCVLNRKFIVLKEIGLSCPNVNWKAQDKHGRTAVSCLISTTFPYVRNTSSTIKGFANIIGSNYLDVFNVADNEGYTPAEYAYASGYKELYQTFLDLGVSEVKKWPIIDHALPSIVEHMQLNIVEADAEAERELLQTRKDALKSDKDKKADEIASIDPDSNLQSVGYIVYENDEPYDIMIMKIDVTQSAHGCNMFYKMSVIFNKVLEVYVLFTKWGTFGDRGSEWHQKTPYQDKESAINEFKSIFKAKTGNIWDGHKSNFVSQPGKFELIKAKQTKDNIVSAEDFDVKDTVSSKFSDGLVQTMHTFCSFADLKRGYKQLQMDLPIGQIPQSYIDEAMVILKELEPLVTKYKDMGSTMTSTEDRTNQRVLIHEIAQKTNAYYRLLPRPSDFSKGGITPILDHYVLRKEKARLLEIGYVNFSANVLLAAKYRSSEIHTMDYAYRALGCQLTDISEESAEFKMINKYMKTTSGNFGDTYQISHVFSVNRQDEIERFEPFKDNFNRKLLWHGSRTENFMGILKQGLLMKPSRANISGSMFGDGLYFADMFCKSVNYSRSSSHPAYATLLLCEVALGNECEMTHYRKEDYQPVEKGHLSVKGIGKNVPDELNALYDDYGVHIPMGPTTYGDNRTTQLNYNEYIVYDTAQVKTRYLVTLRDKNYCYLCDGNKGCKSLDKHIWKKKRYFEGRNKFDTTIEVCYLHRRGKKLETLYDEILDDYIEATDFVNKWNIKIKPPSRNTIVCEHCSKDIMRVILENDMSNNPNDIPSSYVERTLCEDGYSCELQLYNKEVEGSGNPHCELFRHD